MLSKISTINQDLLAYEIYKKDIKGQIEQVLKDKSILLEERWEFFKNIPSEFSNYELYDQTRILFDHDTNAYDDFYKERHETIDVVDIVNSIEESQKGERKFEFKKDLDAIKTRILNKNIRRYKYDW